MKLWGGRFSKETAKQVEEFTESIHVDHVLAQYDIQGSIAHATMLAHCGLLKEHEMQKIIAGLTNIAKKISDGTVHYSIADEDIHMNIERLLFQEIGELAGKLHSGRSRNDQVALDLHLYCRVEIINILENLFLLQQSLIEKASLHVHTVMPGYTHLQQAQPISFAHHLLAYTSMFQRDIERLIFLWQEVNTLPLGAGALAGTSLPIDKNFTAQLLNCDAIYSNSIDAVSNRDFVIVLINNAAIIMMHLSRLSEELILWSSTEFGFIEIDDAFCTGSSMMPQKKNPDVAELIRGKTGRVYGSLFALLTLMKGLPLSYNRDMQEDKQGLFDTITTLHKVLKILPALITTMAINEQTMLAAVNNNNFLCATALSDYLVMKGVPFRETHETVGKLVKYCLQKDLRLLDLPLAVYQDFCTFFAEDLYQSLDAKHILTAKKDFGGSGFNSVKHQLIQARKKLNSVRIEAEKIKKKQENNYSSCDLV